MRDTERGRHWIHPDDEEIDDRPAEGTWQPPAVHGPDRSPAVVFGPPRDRVMMRDAPTLPAMPRMLPEEPTEAAVTASALKSMMGTDYQDTSQVKAIGAAIRTVTFGALVLMVATLGWGVLYVFWGVAIDWLFVAWLGGLVLAVAYLLITEGIGRKYSAAGIEHAKINAAVAIHRDRLESREAMHAAATEAWENVLTKYLEKWGGE